MTDLEIIQSAAAKFKYPEDYYGIGWLALIEAKRIFSHERSVWEIFAWWRVRRAILHHRRRENQTEPKRQKAIKKFWSYRYHELKGKLTDTQLTQVPIREELDILIRKAKLTQQQVDLALGWVDKQGLKGTGKSNEFSKERWKRRKIILKLRRVA
jgi:DNA-directed RNA polymerase specialized sigma subunit